MNNYTKLAFGLLLSLVLTACASTNEGGAGNPPPSTTPMDANSGKNCDANKSCSMTPVKAPMKKVARKAPANFSTRGLRLRKAPKLHLKNRVFFSGSLQVYFMTNSWTLHRNDLNDIVAYAKAYKPTGKCQTFVVEGHADFRGTDGDNMKLSGDRAEGVKKVFARNFRGCIKLKVATFGEKKPLYKGKDLLALRKNRRVVILPDTNVIHRGLAKCEGDVYLLDMSSSMLDRFGTKLSKWNEVVNYQFPKKATFYAFNERLKQVNLAELRSLRPVGMTALVDSLRQVVRTSKASTVITILTDGRDTHSRNKSIYDIIDLAQSKKIKVNVIGIGLYDTVNLTNLAKATGGKLYLASQ